MAPTLHLLAAVRPQEMNALLVSGCVHKSDKIAPTFRVVRIRKGKVLYISERVAGTKECSAITSPCFDKKSFYEDKDLQGGKL